MGWIALYFFALTALVSVALTSLAKPLSFALGVLDRPVGNKQHKRPMPLLGGLALFGAAVLVVVVHLGARAWLLARPDLQGWLPGPAVHLLTVRPEGLAQLAVIAGGGALVVLVGLLDDWTFFDIKWRLLSEVIIAAAVTALGIRPELQGVPPYLTWGVTTLWIVSITNAFNLLDGMDGMAAGVALVSGGLMAIFCLLTHQVMVAFLLAILCGAAAGFLRHNWHPASIYMGSSGSLFLGYMLATVPLVAAFMQEGSRLGAVAMPVLFLSVPVYDTVSVVLIRLWNSRSPVAPDHNHLFHRLQRLGLSVKKVAWIVYLLAFAAGCFAMLLVHTDWLETGLVLGGVGMIFLVFAVIESANVRHRDRKQLVRFRASCFFPGAEDEEEAEGSIRQLTPEGGEMEIAPEAVPAFARALAERRLLTLRILPGEGEHFDPLTVVCRVRSLFELERERAFAGLSFAWKDDYERQTVNAFVASLLYPGRRGESPEQSSTLLPFA